MKRPHAAAGVAAVLFVAGIAASLTAGCGDGGGAAPPAPETAPSAPSARPDGPAAAPAPAPAEAPAPAGDVVLATYDRGLDYLLGLQKDGVWEGRPGTPSPDLTAMAAAALFERPTGMREADAAAANRAVDFLLSQVDEDGTVRGTQTPNYSTSVVVMALAASGRADAKPAIDRCVAKLRTFQFLERGNATYGGIGYGSDRTRSDLSNTQYALASLRAAGVSSDDPVFQEAVAFLARTQNRKENETEGEPASWTDAEGKVYVRANDGGANYRPGDSKAGYDERPDGTRVLRSYGSMTYALLRCYHLAGLPATDGRVKAAVDWISRNWALDHNPGMPAPSRADALFYLYATIGKTLPAAGIDTIVTPAGEVDWRRELAAHLAKLQKPDGSWTNEASSRWEEGNPVIATAFALTALAPCHR